MRVTFDSEANAAYIYLKKNIEPGEVARSELCDIDLRGGPLFLQFDSNGYLIGIEILGAREMLLPETLDESRHA